MIIRLESVNARVALDIDFKRFGGKTVRLRNFFSNGEGLPGAKGQCARQQRTANQSNQAVNVGFHGVEGINQFVYEPCDASLLRLAGKIKQRYALPLYFGDEILMCQNPREPLLLTTLSRLHDMDSLR